MCNGQSKTQEHDTTLDDVMDFFTFARQKYRLVEKNQIGNKNNSRLPDLMSAKKTSISANEDGSTMTTLKLPSPMKCLFLCWKDHDNFFVDAVPMLDPENEVRGISATAEKIPRHHGLVEKMESVL